MFHFPGWRLLAALPALLAAVVCAPLRASGQVSQTSGLGITSSTVLPRPGSPKRKGQEPVSAVEAIHQAREKLQARPDSAKAYLDLAFAFWYANNESEAARAISKALKLNPKFSEAWYYKGLTEADKDKWTAAARAFRTAVSLKPDYPAARLRLGEALLRQGDFAGAKNEWTYVISKDSSNPEAHYGLGLVAMREGRMTQAENEFRTAVRLRGGQGYPEANEKLGETLLRQRQWQAAVRIFKQVLATSPDSLGATSGLATALARLDEADAARKEFSKAQGMLQKKLRFQRAEGDNNHGLQLWMAGNLSQAADSFRRALKEDSTYAEPHNNLGGILWQQGDRKGAIREFKAAISAKPDFAQAHNNLGNALLQTGETAASVKEFRQAVALAPGLVMAHYNLAVALSLEKQTSEAEEQFHQVLALQPAMAAAHVRLGILLATKDATLTAGARSELQEGLRLDPKLSRMIPQRIMKQLHKPETDNRR